MLATPWCALCPTLNHGVNGCDLWVTYPPYMCGATSHLHCILMYSSPLPSAHSPTHRCVFFSIFNFLIPKYNTCPCVCPLYSNRHNQYAASSFHHLQGTGTATKVTRPKFYDCSLAFRQKRTRSGLHLLVIVVSVLVYLVCNYYNVLPCKLAIIHSHIILWIHDCTKWRVGYWHHHNDYEN